MNNCNNLIEDLSEVTSIPLVLFNKLTSTSEDIVCHDVFESFYEHNSVTEINLGIGKLQIYINEDAITYCFVPSNSLEKKLVDVVTNQKDPIITHLEESLTEKILNRYKELF